jgi:cysteine desulfurase
VLALPIYLDNHATTQVDPRVVAAMLPFFSETFGNAGSTTHAFGEIARLAVDDARGALAAAIGAKPREIVFTSGATESNNLAIRGVAERHAARGRHIVSVTTEHPSVLAPLAKLAERGFEVTLLSVAPAQSPSAGCIVAEQVAEAVRDDTILVSVMLANNEIGAVHPLAEIGQLCRSRGVLLHSDATQAVGKMPLDVEQLQVDLMSFSAHKVYGPKGVGALFVRRRRPAVRLDSLIDGGGQEYNLRSGTLNVPGIVGFGCAIELAMAEMPLEAERLRALRARLYEGILSRVSDVGLNGPALDQPELRLPGNLNLRFRHVSGESLILAMRDLAVSSGSACTSAEPEPSHVLRALQLPDDAVHSSIRFGLGRFNTEAEIDYAIERVAESVARLRAMSSMD